MRRVVLLSLLAAGPALAIQPPEGTPSGREPIRVRTVDPQLQALLAAGPAWQAFRAGEGHGWEARFDEVTGTPHRMWGPGIPLGPLPDEAAVARAVLGFVDRHPELLGTQDAAPTLRRVARVEAMDAWYVDVDALRDGLPTWRGGLTFRIRGDRLVMVGAETYPGVPIVGQAVLDADEALAAFQAGGPVFFAPHHPVEAEAMLLPEVRGKDAALRRVWRVRADTEAPYGRWEGFVDAATGEVVAWYNTVRFVDASVHVEHDDRLGRGDLLVSPLRNATLASGEDRLVTDDAGWATLDDPTAWRVRFDGPRLRVLDALGTQEPPLTGPDTTVTSDALGGRLAVASTFVYVQQAQDFARTVAPEVSWVDARVRVHVNIDETCNAWFDGDLNFLREGDGCSNTGRLADVIFHEWAHGFHFHSIVSGSYDGSLGEGAADTLAFLLTDDSRIAPGFFQRSDRPLRDANNRNRYPEHFVPAEPYVHTNGTIFSGAMWDTREALRADLGEPEATRVTAALLAGLLKGGPDLTTAYDEAIFADDDDADLSNGTPHQCALIEGFGKHGLGPLGGFGVAPELLTPLEAAPGVDLAVELRLPDPAPACIALRPDAGTLRWRVNGGAWQHTPLATDGRDLRGAVPGEHLTLGDVLEVYAEILTSSGSVVHEPVGGPIRPHTLHVGDVLEVRCDDFEEDDGGYRHRLLAGAPGEGADDWQWGTPIGLAGDPLGAWSGTKAWGNDLGGGEYDGRYQAEKHNQLRSPVIPTHHYEGVFLRYQRWLSVEDGIYDQALITADGVEVWSNWASHPDRGAEHHLDNAWTPHVVDLAGEGDDGEVRITWEIVSDPGLQLGGWNIDDVCILAPATPDNRLGISDLVASRAEGAVHLSWTMPRHGPVERVRLVRKQGSWPTGPGDGEVVLETSDVTPEAPATAIDPIDGADLRYAVYASDGDHWLSWTREGLNAAAVDPSAGDFAGPGCAGCSGAGRSPGAAALLLGLLALGRRRR